MRGILRSRQNHAEFGTAQALLHSGGLLLSADMSPLLRLRGPAQGMLAGLRCGTSCKVCGQCARAWMSQLILADMECLHLHANVEPVLDDLVAHVRLGLVLVGGHELIRVQVHIQADKPVAQLEAWHERVRREEAGRRVVCSMHASLVSAGSGALETTQLQHSVSRTTQADGQARVSRSRAWRQRWGIGM